MIRAAQLLLLLSAAVLWAASRMPWVSVRSSDGLGQPRTSTIAGAQWSTALLPLAVLLLAAALAGLAVRGRTLRVVAVLVAVTCLALGYLGVGLIVMPDVGPRGAALAAVPVMTLMHSERYLAGAVLTVVAAVLALVSSALLMRAAASSVHASAAAAGSAETGAASGAAGGAALSERAMWDALDDGADPTEGR